MFFNLAVFRTEIPYFINPYSVLRIPYFIRTLKTFIFENVETKTKLRQNL